MECIEGDTIQTGTALVEEDMAKTIRGENLYGLFSGNQKKVLSYIPDPEDRIRQKK